MTNVRLGLANLLFRRSICCDKAMPALLLLLLTPVRLPAPKPEK